jgi:hypothetical protein
MSAVSIEATDEGEVLGLPLAPHRPRTVADLERLPARASAGI